MRAAVFAEYGPPEVLRVVNLPRPEPGPGQVRVRVRAAGVQPFDAGVRRGTMPVPVQFPQQLGNEFAGVVDQVGAGVRDWQPGDEVLGWTLLAAVAEYVVAGADALVRKPSGMPWEVAGALSASGQTAYTALRELRLQAGETLLVHAAAGGVGTVAVQLARARGATVVGTASEPNHLYLAALGATPVTYGDGMVERVRAAAPGGVDAALDAAGGRALPESLQLVPDLDRIATLVDHEEAARLGVRGVRAQRSTAALAELVDLCQQGTLRIHVRARFPLAEVVDAHRLVETGHGAGKVVITLDGAGEG